MAALVLANLSDVMCNYNAVANTNRLSVQWVVPLVDVDMFEEKLNTAS